MVTLKELDLELSAEEKRELEAAGNRMSVFDEDQEPPTGHVFLRQRSYSGRYDF